MRTYVPFVAGAGAMTYARFAVYNVVGGLIWVGICTLAGYAFGTVPIVKNNFSLFALGIVFVSVIPIGIEMRSGIVRAVRTEAHFNFVAAAGPEGPALHGALRSTASAPPSLSALDTRAGSVSPMPAHQTSIQSG